MSEVAAHSVARASRADLLVCQECLWYTPDTYLSRPAARSVSRAIVPQIESFWCAHSRSLASALRSDEARRLREDASRSSAS